MSGAESDEVLALIDHALGERPTDRVRHRLRELATIAGDAPGLAFEELCRIAAAEAALQETVVPDVTLHRAVALDTFQRFCVIDGWRAPFVDPEVFRRYVHRHPEPDAFLLSVLARGTVFPAQHSWLVHAADVEALSGSELVAALQLDKQIPPFVLCRLTAERMASAGVRIRRPTGFDAVLGRHTIWSVDGIPAGDEYVDLDISGSAVEATLWRP